MSIFDREQALRAELREAASLLQAFGEYVTNRILSNLAQNGYDAHKLIRIAPIPRVKEEDSFIRKALYRNKPYTNPFIEITDKVGVRFTLLYESEIEIIESAVLGIPEFAPSCDRDFRKERDEMPEMFQYQGVHYVVRPVEQIAEGKFQFDPSLSCEVQIRTLLQHSVSELSHDLTYKASVDRPKRVKRNVANTVALVESAAHLFTESHNRVVEQDLAMKHTDRLLYTLYETSFRPPQRNENLEAPILFAYRDAIERLDEKEITDFVKQYAPVIRSAINNNFEESLLYRQPVVLALYYLANTEKFRTLEKWPYQRELIEPIYSDLHISLDAFE